MEKQFEVYLGKDAVGKTAVTREGLYYRFICRCRLPGEQIYTLEVMCDDTKANLGVLVPDGKGFMLSTRIPVKQLGEGQLSFRITPRRESVGEQFIPLSPEEPFAYISRLKEAFLAKRGDTLGVILQTETGTE